MKIEVLVNESKPNDYAYEVWSDDKCIADDLNKMKAYSMALEKSQHQLEAVKAERDELKAENERLRHFISRFAYFIGLRNEDIKDFQHKAQELLKEKP